MSRSIIFQTSDATLRLYFSKSCGNRATRLHSLSALKLSSMATYKAETPSQVPSKVAGFYEKFYAISDNSDPSTTSQYAGSFTKDGTLVMGLRTAKGYDEIFELRKGMWAGPVVSRLHTVERIYPFGDDGMNVMLFGNVKYGLKNGKTVFVEWAGRADLVEEGEDVKMKFYQVYLDGSVVANALKE